MDRNLILAVALSAGILILWQVFVAGPQEEAYRAAREAAEQADAASDAAVPGADAADLGVIEPAAADSLDEALAETPGRVPIDTPSLDGSINLLGGRIDDVMLKRYREELDPESSEIRVLRPRAAKYGHYIEHGWATAGENTGGATWSAPEGARLTPETPVTLTLRRDGLVYEKTFEVDERFMFTVTQTVRNESNEAATLTPYGIVVQRGVPDDLKNFMILHEGPVGIIGGKLYERKYKKLQKTNRSTVREEGTGGWLGITKKYWLAAAIPPQDAPFTGGIDKTGPETNPLFRASYALNPVALQSGETLSITSHAFAGAKDVDILQSYEHAPDKGGLGVLDFDKAIDWGHLFFLTRPIFYTLNFFGDLIGNFGVAILILTLIIKAILFPVANKAFETASKMKKLQPQVKKLQERYKDDKQKMQQEMMALYQREKMNPLAGCIPILIQMPIFFALYKTLFVTIELRHEPFFGWIRDLAAPDPTTVFNLFGLLPYDPTAIPAIGGLLGIGVLPLLMGAAMWFQTKLNPPPADPMQAQMFAMMPIVFTFLFARFAAGLVLYWFWNTALSILQQWLIMKKNGVSIDWGERFKLPSFLTKKKPVAGE
ncbi:MAG: membrane protein insertase YidC [Parvularculaceae bacterium]